MCWMPWVRCAWQCFVIIPSFLRRTSWMYSTQNCPYFDLQILPMKEAGNSDKSWKILGLTHSQVAPCFTSQHLSPLSSVLEFWLKTSQENMTWFHIIIKFVVLFIGHMSNHSLRFISHLLTHSQKCLLHSYWFLIRNFAKEHLNSISQHDNWQEFSIASGRHLILLLFF